VKARINAFDSEIKASVSSKLSEIDGARTSVTLAAAERIVYAEISVLKHVVAHSSLQVKITLKRGAPLMCSGKVFPNPPRTVNNSFSTSCVSSRFLENRHRVPPYLPHPSPPSHARTRHRSPSTTSCI
jgi:hypothetical protein